MLVKMMTNTGGIVVRIKISNWRWMTFQKVKDKNY